MEANVTLALYKILLPIIMTASGFYNTSFSISVFHESLENEYLSLAHGANDKYNPDSQVNIGNKFPVGSVTKSASSIATLSLHEQGILDIDKPVHIYVDPLMMRDNGTTLMGIFKNDSITRVTARMLMHMNSGVPDYDDDSLRNFTYEYPDYDVTPYDLLYGAAEHGMLCEPGTCGQYSTTGFNLLGLTIAGALNLSSWKDLNQAELIPKDIAAGMIFPKGGHCSKYEKDGIVHQYTLDTKKIGINKIEADIFDLMEYSCLNSWTGGNLAGSSTAIGKMYYDLFRLRILKPETVQQMIQFETSGGFFHYGLGIMAFDYGDFKHPNPSHPWYSYGHIGMDYGSGGLGLYTPHNNFSISITTNSVSGLNCSDPFFSKEQQSSFFLLYCVVLKANLEFFSGEKLDDFQCHEPFHVDYPISKQEIFETIPQCDSRFLFEDFQEMIKNGNSKTKLLNPKVECKWL